jgi:hypothetical protein
VPGGGSTPDDPEIELQDYAYQQTDPDLEGNFSLFRYDGPDRSLYAGGGLFWPPVITTTTVLGDTLNVPSLGVGFYKLVITLLGCTDDLGLTFTGHGRMDYFDAVLLPGAIFALVAVLYVQDPNQTIRLVASAIMATQNETYTDSQVHFSYHGATRPPTSYID